MSGFTETEKKRGGVVAGKLSEKDPVLFLFEKKVCAWTAAVSSQSPGLDEHSCFQFHQFLINQSSETTAYNVCIKAAGEATTFFFHCWCV